MHTFGQFLRGWTRRHTAGAVCLLIAIALTVNALTSLSAALDLLKFRDLIAQSHEMFEALQDIEAVIKDADMEARGYSLTGQPEFLESHRNAVARMEKSLLLLRAKMASDPDPLVRLPELERLVVERIGIVSGEIDLQATDGRQAAAHLVSTGQGRLSMERIRRVLTDMEQTERATLEHRKAQASEATRVTTMTFIAVNVTALVVLFFAYFLALAYVRRRERMQEQVQKAYSELEVRVQERTADLARVNDELNRDIELRKKMAEEREVMVKKMMEALAEVKTLSGLLPMCSNCKSIRDDRGYWKRIEAYISEHSDAEFSHGLCPKCASELYPDIFGARKK